MTTNSVDSHQSQKDKVHVLVGCLVTWSKQIKEVLKMDPDNTPHVDGNYPGPMDEYYFWAKKSANLHSVFRQLETVSCKKAWIVLEKKTNPSFERRCFIARQRLVILKPLTKYLELLESEPEFEKLEEFFPPIMHITLLIWKRSKHFAQNQRLVSMMREVSNAIIAQTVTFLSGSQIFEMVDNDEANKATKMVQLIFSL